MKKVAILLVVVFLIGAAAYAGAGEKLWWTKTEAGDRDAIYYIEDRETGTRCYAIRDFGSGIAISCVKK